MSLGSVSASKDVIGDPSRPGTNNIYYWNQDKRKREKVLDANQFQFYQADKKDRNLWWEKMCL